MQVHLSLPYTALTPCPPGHARAPRPGLAARQCAADVSKRERAVDAEAAGRTAGGLARNVAERHSSVPGDRPGGRGRALPAGAGRRRLQGGVQHHCIAAPARCPSPVLPVLPCVSKALQSEAEQRQQPARPSSDSMLDKTRRALILAFAASSSRHEPSHFPWQHSLTAFLCASLGACEHRLRCRMSSRVRVSEVAMGSVRQNMRVNAVNQRRVISPPLFLVRGCDRWQTYRALHNCCVRDLGMLVRLLRTTQPTLHFSSWTKST